MVVDQIDPRNAPRQLVTTIVDTSSQLQSNCDETTTLSKDSSHETTQSTTPNHQQNTKQTDLIPKYIKMMLITLNTSLQQVINSSNQLITFGQTFLTPQITERAQFDIQYNKIMLNLLHLVEIERKEAETRLKSAENSQKVLTTGPAKDAEIATKGQKLTDGTDDAQTDQFAMLYANPNYQNLLLDFLQLSSKHDINDINAILHSSRRALYINRIISPLIELRHLYFNTNGGQSADSSNSTTLNSTKSNQSSEKIASYPISTVVQQQFNNYTYNPILRQLQSIPAWRQSMRALDTVYTSEEYLNITLHDLYHKAKLYKLSSSQTSSSNSFLNNNVLGSGDGLAPGQPMSTYQFKRLRANRKSTTADIGFIDCTTAGQETD
jgi:hypothetical protein